MYLLGVRCTIAILLIYNYFKLEIYRFKLISILNCYYSYEIIFQCFYDFINDIMTNKCRVAIFFMFLFQAL